MAHEVETAMYVKHPAWHGEGQVLSEAPTTEGAKEASGLMWGVVLNPLHMTWNGVHVDTEMCGITRETDGRILGYARQSYEPWQNDAAFEWTRPFVESGLYTYEAAGSLRNGEVCWTLLKHGEYEPTAGDKINGYKLLTWGHDGKTCVTTGATSVRVVCMNTLRAAMRDKNDGWRKVRHTSKVKDIMEMVRKEHELETEAFIRQQHWFEQLLARPVTLNERAAYIDRLCPPPPEDAGKRAVTIREGMVEFLSKMASGMASGMDTFPGIGDNAYGLFQAVEEGIEHFIGGKKIKDRGENILFGSGNDRSIRAEELMNDLLAAPVGMYGRA